MRMKLPLLGALLTLSLAASGTPGLYLLPRVLAAFHELYPGVEIDYDMSESEHALDLVRAHQAELGIVGTFLKHATTRFKLTLRRIEFERGINDSGLRILRGIGGEEVSSLPDRRRSDFRRSHVGFVYQADNLLPFLTVAENVGLQLALDGESTGADRSLELLDRLGLAGEAKRLPDHLSGGQRQRVAVARAVVHRPEVILADEPTGALDAANAAGVIDLLLEVQREIGATLVIVTHDRDAARRMDRRIGLRDGRVT